MLRELWTRYRSRPACHSGRCRRRRRHRALHRARPLEQLETWLALAGLVVSNPSVNEASPYAVLAVKGTASEAISLSLGGTATGGGVDYGPGLEWTTDGTSWTTYTSGTITLSAGDGEAFVRLPIVNCTAIYKITDHWGLRAGYSLIWLDGLALGPNQWDFTDTADSGKSLAGGSSFFLHGANLGVERRW